MERVNEPDNYQLNKIIVFSLKLILMGLSAAFFLYETIELIRLYHNYDTIVSIYYENKELKQIPSLTVCLPTILDKNKLFDRYPDLRQKLKEVPNDDKRKNILTEYLDKVLESMLWTNLTVEEVEAFNCTLNYWSITSNLYAIDSDKMRSGLNCREVVKPIESYSNAKTKCFTYFSRLSADNNFDGKYSLRDGIKNLNDLYEIISIELNLDSERFLSLGFIQNETTITIHNQNVIENYGKESQLIEVGYQYDITINTITTKLLEKPYKTSCYDYNRKTIGVIQSRKQCIDRCVIDLYRDKCNCIPIQLTNTIQLLNRSSHIVCSRRDSRLRSNECYEDISHEIGLCLTSDRCPHECLTIRYSYQTKAKKLMTSSEEMNANVTDDNQKKVLIKIRLDENRGETFVMHVPLMSFGQLLADISALIALFTGLSLISMANFLIKTLPTIRLIPTQVTDESNQNTGQEIKQNIRHCLSEKSSSQQIENIIDFDGSSQRENKIGTGVIRPSTSVIYDSHIKSNNTADNG